jgi:hypothetical protein
MYLGIHRTPKQTDTTIHFTSNHPLEHKLAAYIFHINRMITLSINEQAKQFERSTILTMARNKLFPLQIIHNVKKKLMLKHNKQKPYKHNKKGSLSHTTVHL